MLSARIHCTGVLCTGVIRLRWAHHKRKRWGGETTSGLWPGCLGPFSHLHLINDSKSLLGLAVWKAYQWMRNTQNSVWVTQWGSQKINSLSTLEKGGMWTKTQKQDCSLRLPWLVCIPHNWIRVASGGRVGGSREREGEVPIPFQPGLVPEAASGSHCPN